MILVCCTRYRVSQRWRLPGSWSHKFDSGADYCGCVRTSCRSIRHLQKVSTPHTYVWQSTVLWKWPDTTGRRWYQQTDRECGSRKHWAHYNLVICTSYSSAKLTMQLDVLKPVTQFFNMVYIQLFNNISTNVPMIECI